MIHLLAALLAFSAAHAEYTPLPADTQESIDSNFKAVDVEVRRLDEILNTLNTSTGAIAASGATASSTITWTGAATFLSSFTFASPSAYNTGVADYKGVGWWAPVAISTPSQVDCSTFTNLTNNLSRKYRVEWELDAITTDGFLYIRFNNDAGNNYQYINKLFNASGGDDSVASAASSRIPLVNDSAALMNSGTGGKGNFEFSVEPRDLTIVHVSGSSSYLNSSAVLSGGNIDGVWTGSGMNRITICQSGLKMSGYITLFAYIYYPQQSGVFP